MPPPSDKAPVVPPAVVRSTAQADAEERKGGATTSTAPDLETAVPDEVLYLKEEEVILDERDITPTSKDITSSEATLAGRRESDSSFTTAETSPGSPPSPEAGVTTPKKTKTTPPKVELVGGEVPNAYQPGHIYNLSDEQGRSLVRFWHAILAYLDGDDEYLEKDGLSSAFEILEKPVADPNSQESLAVPSTPPATGSSPRRSGFSLFSKKPSQESLKSAGAATRMISRDDLRRTFWHTVRTDHPDTLLLRFLRARKWDLPKALAMLVNALRWQFTENVDRVIADGEDAIPLNQFESGKTLVRGVDLQGRPVTYVRARFHFKDAQTAEVNKLFTILTMETVRIMLSPPVETATMVFDLRGLTMANSDLGTIKFLVGCFEAFYPESLGKALIVGAPWIFWGLWRVISPLLDPVVASKICILKKESELLDYIAPDQLVSSLGGEDDRPYVYIPPFPEDQMRLQDVTEKERLIELVTEIQGRLTQATKDWDGSVESPEYHQRMELAEELRRRTLALDPYVRARVNLHRLDVIREDGTTDFSRYTIPKDVEVNLDKEGAKV